MKTTFIAGPCVIESAELLDIVAAKLVDINQRLGTDIIFKASYDKANRTSISSFRGPGIDKGLLMLNDIKEKYGLRILTDIHVFSQTFTRLGRLNMQDKWWTSFRFLLSCAARQIYSLPLPEPGKR